MFTYPIAIDPADIDHMGHVNNATYLRWTQDAVVAFWRARAPVEAVAKYLWIALEHTIRYRKPSFLGDPIRAELTVQQTSGARAYFSTRILRDNVILTEIASCWCALDAATLRPKRIADDVLQRVLQWTAGPGEPTREKE